VGHAPFGPAEGESNKILRANRLDNSEAQNFGVKMGRMRQATYLLLIMAGFWACSAAAEDRPQRPNVLFIMADDLTANALGCYGNDKARTPNLDKLALRGTVMDRAYCQYPVCGAARAALMTGLYPQQNGVTGNPNRDTLTASLGDHPTLPQHFKQHGYTTARVGKIYHMNVPGDITAGAPGTDHPASWSMAYNIKAPEWMSHGKSEHLSNEKLNKDPEKHYGLGFGTAFYIVQANNDDLSQHDSLAADKAIALLGELKDKPFFLAVGFVRPHVPFVAPQSYFDPLDATKLPLPEQVDNDLADIPRAGWSRIGAKTGTDTDEKRKRVLRGYYASVSYMDAQVGRLLDELDRLKLTDNTIVVFLSDHGYHLGEHDFWQKMSLHEESAKIPLIAAGQGIEPGKRWDGFVESVDIYPTLCLMAGLPIPKPCAGMVLYGTKDDPRSSSYTTRSGSHLLRTKEYAYMRYKDGSEELYDMVKDPKQFTNLAGLDEHRDAIELLRKQLDEKLKEFAEKK